MGEHMEKLNQELTIVSTLDEALRIVNLLNMNGIHNTYKVHGRSNTWLGRGTARSYLGSGVFHNDSGDKYCIYVGKEQYEKARKLI